MDGAAFQGMPRIALTPAEEALVPRPHSSASQVATAVPSAYSRHSTSPGTPRHPHHPNQHSSLAYHPYYANSSAANSTLAGLHQSPSSASIPLSADQYSRPASPSPHLQQQQQQQSSLSIYSIAGASTSSAAGGGGVGAIAPTTPASGSEQEYPQNPQDGYYSQVSPRPSSPGPPRLAFSLTPRPARSPSPQLYGNLYDQNYQPRSSYFSRGSYDAQPRPGSPLQQEHQESWDSSVRMESPAQMTDSEEDTDSDDEAEEDSRPRRKRRPEPSKHSNSKSILRRLKESTSRMSFGDDTSASASQRPYRTSQESDRAQRNSRDSSSTSLPGKEVLQDLSDEEKQQEPRKSRSAWRPSLSLIRQESDGSGMNSYLQNDPNRISGQPSNESTGPRRSTSNNRILNNNNNNNSSSAGAENKQKKSARTKNGKKKKRASKKRKAKEAATRQLRQQQLQQQQLAKQEDLSLPTLVQVLEKKTRYPLSYDDFEAFLRSRRAVEYLNFWTDVTAHEQLCRTFDVSERRQKRELQLEERAIARDRRRMALMAAVESGKLGADTDFLTPGHASIGAGTGIGIGASGQEIDGSNLYLASRSSLQLPLNDHLSFPQESRRYGLHDSSAPFPPPPSTLHGGNHGSGAYNRLLSGIGGRRISGERSRPSLEEEHISEQDAAVAAVVALKDQQKAGEQYDYNNASREDVRRGSLDFYRPMPMHGSSHLRYQQNNNSSGHVGGGTIPSTHSSPNAYNLMMRGRGSVDMMPRSNSRSSRVRPSASEDYFGNGIRRTTSQQFQNQQHPSLSNEAEEGSGAGQVFEVGESNMYHMSSPLGPRRQLSHQSLSIQEPDWNRRPSTGRISGGIGPLQAPVSIRRSGESAYAPSIFSNGEGKALLVQSFRTISLEDLQESALRIYRKYLIQLRTAPMAAEEEAASSSMKALNEAQGNLNRASLEKTMAPGWDGYAEEVIAQWNENWRGRRANRLSGRRSFASRGGLGGTSGQTSTVDDDARAEKDGSSSLTKPDLTVHTGDSRAGDSGSGDEEVEEQQAKDLSTNPKSPTSPRLKKRAGTGLSSVLPPFLSRILRTEVTVVELPTLTINTTTVEETAVPEESEEDDSDDEDDDEEDYDSDEEDETDDEENEVKQNTSFTTAKPSEKSSEKSSEKPSEIDVLRKDSANPVVEEKVALTFAHSGDEEEVVILDKYVPTVTPPPNNTGGNNNALGTASGETPTVITFRDQLAGDGVGSGGAKTSGSRHRRHSSASSLSSSWDKISKHDVEKSVSILPSPITASLRSSPYKRGGVRGIRARATGRAANMASRTAQKVGWQLSALLNQSLRKESSSDSLDVIRVTPTTSPRIEGRDFRFQIPDIVMNNSSSQSQIHNQAQYEGQNGNEAGRTEPHSTELYPEGHPLTLIPTNNTDNGRQDNGSHGKDHGLFSTHRHQSFRSTLQLPKSFLTPATSSITNPTMSNSSSSSSPTQSNAVIGNGGAPPLFTGPSSATVASSAAAAAFYLPLECRQRIHTQVQEEGRTEAPYLYGPAKGFVLDVVLQDHYYPLFLKYVEQQNLGLLNQGHPNNQVKRRGAIWVGILAWVAVFGLQLMLVLMNKGGWKSPWVWIVGIVGGWPGSIFLATGIKGFSPLLGVLGRMSEDKHILRTRKILEPSIRVRHQLRAYWMLSYCIFWSTMVMVVFAALPQRVS